jgi:tetratricopeptide (TPR) repeat protein
MSWLPVCSTRAAMACLRAATIVASLVVLHAHARAEPVRFEPPSSVEAAQNRYLSGKKYFEAKQYAVAADEFAAAYQLDPQAKFLLFNLGLARRLAGACQEAIEAYRTLLDAGPPKQLAANTQVGIDRCEKIVATLPEPSKPEPAAEPPLPKPKPRPPAVEIDARPTDSREPWYRDRTGNLLVLGGGLAAGTASVLYVLARDNAAATTAPSSLQAYEGNRVRASQLQIASAITGAAAVVLVVAGVVHYAAHRPEPRRLAAVPVDGGAMVVVGGQF